MQVVQVSVRILSRPSIEKLPQIYQTLGTDYDKRVLPSIANEVLKAVVVCGLGFLLYALMGLRYYRRNTLLHSC